MYGIPSGPEDCRATVTSLMAEGSPRPLTAAKTMNRGFDVGAQLVALTTEERDPILSVLEDVRRQRSASSAARSRATGSTATGSAR